MTDDQYLVDGELFLGRVEAQNEFRQALRLVMRSDQSNNAPYIFLITGKPGMGKSRLVRRLRDIAAKEAPFETSVQTILVDWGYQLMYSAEGRGITSFRSANYVFNKLYLAARDAGWGHQFADYQAAARRLNRTEKQVFESIEQEGWGFNYGNLRALNVDEITALLRSGDQPVGADVYLSPHLKVAAGGTQALDLARRQAQEWFTSTQQYEPEEEEVFLAPNNTFAETIGLGLAKVAQGKPLVVLMDSYQVLGTGDPWLRTIMAHAGPKVVWVIAGVEDLSPFSDTFSDRSAVVQLEPFTEEHVAQYLRERTPDRLVTRNSVEKIFRLTRGVPLAMQLAGDLWAGGVPISEITGDIPPDAEQDTTIDILSQRLLEYCSDPLDRLTLMMLAIQPRPNENTFFSVLQPARGEFEVRSRIRLLKARFKSIRSNGSIYLHPIIAGYLGKFLLRRRIRISEDVKAIAARAARHSMKMRIELESNFPRLEDRFENQEWRDVMLDSLHWLFMHNEFDGWRQVNRDFVDALGYDLAHAKNIIEVVERIEQILSSNGRQRLEIYQSGLATQIANRVGEAPQSLSELDGQVALLAELERWLTRYGEKDEYASERRAILDIRRGELFYWYGQYEDGLKMYLKAEKNIPNRGEALRRQLARDYERVGERLAWVRDGYQIVGAEPSPRAETSLKKAISLGRRRAMSFHALGAVQDKLGKLDTALENLLQAVTLNPDNRDAWFCLGNVYRKLELMSKAVPAYKRAVRLDPEFTQARLHLAATYRYENEAQAFKKELAALTRLVRGESPVIQAGYYSLKDQPAKALELLASAVQGNRGLIDTIREDPCFEYLKQHEKFHELINLY